MKHKHYWDFDFEVSGLGIAVYHCAECGKVRKVNITNIKPEKTGEVEDLIN